MIYLDALCWMIGFLILCLGGVVVFVFVSSVLINMILSKTKEHKLFIEFAQWRMNKWKQENIKLKFPNIVSKYDKGDKE